MKKKLVVALISAAMVTSMLGACGSSNASSSSASSTATSSVSASSASEEDTTAASSSVSASSASEEVSADADQEAADKVAALIDAIYVQERNDNTDEQCKEAKEAWDALTDAQKELVEGENADPDYFGRDTGDASKDDPLNGDEIGENELLVVSFGTSYNDSRRLTVGAIENAIETAFPDYSVRRGFTSQIIIDHVKKRDNVAIDNVAEALNRAIDNGVKNLVVQPTHLMNGLEYTDLVNELAENSDAFEHVAVGEPLLTSDDDFKTVISAITDATKEYDDGETAICFMGHGTEADSNAVYQKMQDMLKEEGFDNYYVGTVEATPSCEDVIAQVKEGSYKKVVLEPLMIVAGDHANNDMAGDDDDSWKSQFKAAGYEVTCLVRGLGELEPIQQLFVQHAQAAIDSLAK